MRTPAMIGRRSELARLLDTWRGQPAGECPWLFVGGDAGMGKTTLISALIAALGDDALAVTGQCMPLAEEGLPLVPIAQVLRHLLDVHGRARVLDWAGAGRSALGALVPELGAPTSDGEQRLRLFEATARVLEGAARERPLLIVIEDLHWADATTRELLRFCKVAVCNARIMVIGTYRTDELTRRHPLRPWLAELLRTPHTGRIDLEPLPAAEARALAVAALGPGADDATVDLITERAEGIPYFVEELACADFRGCDLPWTLRDTLLVRVLALPETTQALLRLASAAGNRVDHRLLATVHDGADAQLDTELRSVLDAQLLVADDAGYAFRHALLREAIHDDALPGEHVRLHGRYADAIAADVTLATPAELVHHLFAAQRFEEAFGAALKLARAQTLPLEALGLFERILGVWQCIPDASAAAEPHHVVLREAAEAASEAGLPNRTLRYADASLAALPVDSDPEVESRLHLLRARALTNQMDPRSDAAYARALAVLPDEPDVLRLETLAAQATHLMLLGRPQTAVEHIDQALAEADHVQATRRRDLAVALLLNTRATLLNGLGDEATFEVLMERSRKLVDGHHSHSLRYYTNTSDALHVAGHFRRAADVALAGTEHAARRGLERSWGTMLGGNAALPLLMLGEVDRARELVERALAHRPPEKFRLQLDILAAALHVWDGAYDEATTVLGTFRGARMAAATYYPQYLVDFAQVASSLAIATGDHAGVERCLGLVGDIERGRGTGLWQVVGDAARSRRERGLPVVDGLGEVLPLGGPDAHRVWQTLIEAEDADTVDRWRALLDHDRADALGRPTLAYARLQLARTLGTTGREEWATGRDDARLMAHRPLLAAYAATGTRLGFTSAATGVLTPREREVIDLVAQGLSNGEIAKRLVISGKTASVHVSNILAKLGATSRTQAAMEANRRGLLPH